MRRLPRFIPALVLVVLYTMIVVSPLAPLAMRSAAVAHFITGECASDCSICGCSTERSANHTCCCWLKKLQAGHDDDQDQPECCKKSPTDKKNTKAFISTRPCSSGNTATLVGSANGDVFPYRFSKINPIVLESTVLVRYPDCRSDWPGEPPDPPPKISRST